MAKLRGEKKKKKMHFFSGLKNNNILDNYIIDIFQYLPRFFKGFFSGLYWIFICHFLGLKKKII